MFSIEETQLSGLTPVLIQAKNKPETQSVINHLHHCIPKAFQARIHMSHSQTLGLKDALGKSPAQGRKEGSVGARGSLRTT